MEARNLPISSIYVKDGFNPRKHFDESKLQELADDIKHRGLIQPIVVRPEPCNDGEFQLVAGERRWRAAQIAGVTEILSVVRECTLTEAMEMAVAENEKREGVSAGEEALAAQKILDQLDGDRALAAKELGWSRSKLDSRLLLLHAVPEVLDALSRGQIYIGHAEKLSGLPEETQKGTLAKVIADKVSVAELGRRIEGFAIPLATACFDTSGCQGCPHNSSSQLGLFADAVSEGLCQNRACFSEKTTAALEGKRETLKGDFNVVVLATEKPDGECRPLVKEGATGVGHTQFSACQQCAHFGARIENRLNGQTGQVVEGMCFNTKCNDEKQAAYKAALAADQEASASNQPTKSASGPAPSSQKKSASADLPKATKVAISAQVRQRMPKIVDDTRSLQLALMIDALRHFIGSTAALSLSKSVPGLPDSVAKELGKTGFSVGSVARIPVDELQKAVAVLVRALPAQESLASQFDPSGYAETQLNRAVSMAKVAERKGSDLFEVNADFLATLPKKAIASMLAEVGFEKWFLAQDGDDRAKAYKALLANKKVDLPKAIMYAGFDWQGVVPKQVGKFLKLS